MRIFNTYPCFFERVNCLMYIVTVDFADLPTYLYDITKNKSLEYRYNQNLY